MIALICSAESVGWITRLKGEARRGARAAHSVSIVRGLLGPSKRRAVLTPMIAVAGHRRGASDESMRPCASSVFHDTRRTASA